MRDFLQEQGSVRAQAGVFEWQADDDVAVVDDVDDDNDSINRHE